MSQPYLIPFTIGLFSSLHCLGMCGGIIGALSLSLPEKVRNNRWQLSLYVFAYNLGRIGSYALAGALIGLVGTQLFNLISPEYGHTLLRIFAALMLAGIGLYIAGWLPRMAMVESLGVPLWRRLEPLGRRLIPVRSPIHACIFGAIWGWLPCGMVYTTLLWTASAGSASYGALYMIAFGIGTLPVMLTAGLIAGLVTKFNRTPRFRQAMGLILIAYALVSIWFDGSGFFHVQSGDFTHHSSH